MSRAEIVEADREAEILDTLRRGDHDTVLELLMDAHGIALYRFCRRIVVDGDLADEAHQVTFVQAYRSLDSFSGRSSIRTWLFSIARHRCLDLLKSHRRRLHRFELVGEVPESGQSQPTNERIDGRIEARDRSEALDQCLGQLAEGVRTAVGLRYREGMSYAEMEVVCGDRANTLQARVARALPVLRRCLEARGWAA